jgi:hypothetical protein
MRHCIPTHGWAKVAAGMVAGMAVGGAAVHADGGDGSLVHACVNQADKTRPNVIIVAASDGCPPSYTSTHWSIQGPKGEQGLPGPQGAQGPQGSQADTPQAPAIETSPADLSAFVNRLKRRTAARKTVKAQSPLDSADGKIVDAKCPGSHPRAVLGVYQAYAAAEGKFEPGIGDPAEPPLFPIAVSAAYNGPVGPIAPQNRWRTAAFVGGETRWRLEVTAFCTRAGRDR